MKDKLGIWYLSSPVSTQDDHEEYDNDPEQLSDQSLVAEEDVDDALDGRVLRVVLHPISLNVSERTDGFINFWTTMMTLNSHVIFLENKYLCI